MARGVRDPIAMAGLLADELRTHPDFGLLRGEADRALERGTEGALVDSNVLRHVKFGRPMQALPEHEQDLLYGLDERFDKTDANLDSLMGRYKETWLELCNTDERKNEVKKELAMADSYNDYMKEKMGQRGSKRADIYRFVQIQEMEQIAETDKFSNIGSSGKSAGNREFDGHDTKSFTLNRNHQFQHDDRCPIRITFKNHNLDLEILRMDMMLPRFKSVKYGQRVSASNMHEMELRMYIDENRKPPIPRDLAVNIPLNMLNDMGSETLKRLKDKYLLTHESNYR